MKLDESETIVEMVNKKAKIYNKMQKEEVENKEELKKQHNELEKKIREKMDEI